MSLLRIDRRHARSWRVRSTLSVIGSLLALALPGAAGDMGEADQTSGRPKIDSPNEFHCVGRNRFSGAASVPTERAGITTDRAYAAIFFDPVQGHAIIVYGERYQQLAPLFQAFIRRHECQHANGVQDEIMANCRALMQMRALGLDTEQEQRIAQWHAAEGSIDAQYGGTGARFWERTVACAGTR